MNSPSNFDPRHDGPKGQIRRARRGQPLVVLPPGLVPMTEQEREHAATAWRALFVTYLRNHGRPWREYQGEERAAAEPAKPPSGSAPR
jgi:hypothetical protein